MVGCCRWASKDGFRQSHTDSSPQLITQQPGKVQKSRQVHWSFPHRSPWFSPVLCFSSFSSSFTCRPKYRIPLSGSRIISFPWLRSESIGPSLIIYLLLIDWRRYKWSVFIIKKLLSFSRRRKRSRSCRHRVDCLRRLRTKRGGIACRICLGQAVRVFCRVLRRDCCRKRLIYHLHLLSFCWRDTLLGKNRIFCPCF